MGRGVWAPVLPPARRSVLTPGSCSHRCVHHTVVFYGQHITFVTEINVGRPPPLSGGGLPRAGSSSLVQHCPGPPVGPTSSAQGSRSSRDGTPGPRGQHQDRCWPVKNALLRRRVSVGLTLMVTEQPQRETFPSAQDAGGRQLPGLGPSVLCSSSSHVDVLLLSWGGSTRGRWAGQGSVPTRALPGPRLCDAARFAQYVGVTVPSGSP